MLLTACSGSDVRERVAVPAPVDLTGSWEMNYGRSDKVEERLRSIAREFQRQQERRERMGSNRPTLDAGDSSRRAFNSLLATARLADMITRSQVVDINQKSKSIQVHRDENFSLNCEIGAAVSAMERDSLGIESCRWEGKDLLYMIQLPDGLGIRHRLTLAPEGDQLRIATTVVASNSTPFTLNRFYYRFEPPEEVSHCKFTLSKGKVCTRSAI
jgi:hypothetical protein